ncbi:unnamed protein product [Lactuca virosa]|uniref:Secreted protein n=1 Tax=Lactuca virosa TaxID=75947 RepID=A0AAU9MSL0_9ASTR|nr:unnamed protein product [Lactuca virosa]
MFEASTTFFLLLCASHLYSSDDHLPSHPHDFSCTAIRLLQTNQVHTLRFLPFQLQFEGISVSCFILFFFPSSFNRMFRLKQQDQFHLLQQSLAFKRQ